MMADAPVSESVQVRLVEIFENERYSPLSGWSFKGLLPSDRNAFTTCDGRDGFTTMNEATEALVSLGWRWVKDQEWAVDLSLSNVDAEGWTYSTDFTSLKDETYGNKVKGVMHFVRRRKYTRYQCFDVKLLAPPNVVLTCSYCDFEEVGRLSALLLDKLALASALKHPTQNSEAKTVVLKNRMIDALQLGALSKSRESITYYISMIEGFLTTFVNQSKSAWSAASGMMSSESHEETLRKRTAWLTNTYFTTDEAQELARLIIRVLDQTNAFHCDQPQCGAKCEFFLETCPNAGCGVGYSRKWASQHDTVCPHKIVACERVCGENLKRLKMDEHLAHECGLRIVQCPCYDLGCATELAAREVEKHVQESQVDHLCMVVRRVKEMQVVLGKHQGSLNALDATAKDQQRQITGLAAGAATALGLIQACENRSDSKMKDHVRSLEAKINKDGTAIAANRTDINSIKAHLLKK